MHTNLSTPNIIKNLITTDVTYRAETNVSPTVIFSREFDHENHEKVQEIF